MSAPFSSTATARSGRRMWRWAVVLTLHLSGSVSMRRSDEMNLRKRALRGRDLVVFSNDWDGDPLSKTHIMRILARDNRILWVNSIGNRRPDLSARDLERIGKKIADIARGLREEWPNLHVLVPIALPAFGTMAPT